MTRSRFQVTKRKPREARTTVDGQVFDSVGEMKRYEILRSRFDVRNLRRQVKFPIMMRQYSCVEVPMLTATGRQMTYTIDFIYEELQPSTHGANEWVTVYEEYKGMDTPEQFIRRQIVARYNGFAIRVTGPAGKKLNKQAAS